MSGAEIVAELLLAPPDRPDRSCFEFFKDEPFRWTSGTIHPVYTDNRLLQSMPTARDIITDYMADEIVAAEITPEGLAAVFSSAIFHTDGLARMLGLPMVTARTEPKSHGTDKFIEGIIDPGLNYLVIEDLFSTGGSAIKAANAVRQEGGIVTHALSIVTYGWPETYHRFKEANLIPISLTNFSTILRVAIKLGQVDEKMKAIIED